MYIILYYYYFLPGVHNQGQGGHWKLWCLCGLCDVCNIHGDSANPLQFPQQSCISLAIPISCLFFLSKFQEKLDLYLICGGVHSGCVLCNSELRNQTYTSIYDFDNRKLQFCWSRRLYKHFLYNFRFMKRTFNTTL